MASVAREPSVAELRRDAERTRTNLTGTVEELRSQVAETADHVRNAVAPSTIKRQVSEYVRESGENLMQSLQRRARENPLQAVAVGAGLAYPLWNLMRAIPAPLLLIGAGLALSRSSALREGTDEALAQAREKVSELGDSARRTVHDARDVAGSVADRVAGLVSSVGEEIGDMAGGAAGSTKDGTESMSQGGGALDAAGEKISSLADQARQTMSSTYDQNPLLIAGIGLAVGALIASALPATQVENRVFGETSDKLRQRATDAAAQGIDTVKEIADGVVDAAAQEGLSGEGLAAAAGDLTQKVRAVAERGVNTALGEKTR
jgi:hypothetical protein